MLLEKVSVHTEILFVCCLKQNVCSVKIVHNKNLGKKKKNQNHTCTIRRNTTNSFIPLSNNIQFSRNTEKEHTPFPPNANAKK
jgi:hypothetical protein